MFDLTSVPTITNAKLQNSAMTLAGSSVSLGGTGVANTDALSEGSSNLYFTNARVQSFLGGGTLAGNIVVPDNQSIYVGSSSDFRIVHNTTNTQLTNATGALQITSNGGITVTGATTFSADLTVDTDTLKVDSTNNRVGIGVASPGAALSVSGLASLANLGGGSTGSAAIYVNSTSGHTGEMLQILKNGSTRMEMTNAGNLGIGESSPSAKFHLKKTAASTQHYDQYATAIIEDTEARLQIVASEGGSNAAGLLLTNEAKHWGVVHHGTGNSNIFSIGYYASSSSGVDLSDNLSDILNITTGGKVGIGNAPTDGVLHVHTASAGTVTASTQADDIVIENNAEGGMTIITPDDQSARIRFTSPSTNNAVGGATIFYRQNINKMNIGTEVSGGILALHSGAGSETMRLDASGNVTIGAKDYHTHNSGVDSLQIGYAFNLYEDSYNTGTDNYAVWANNSYYSASGGNKYMRNDEASRIMQANGTFTFQNAAAGTADNAVTFVNRMIIDSGGTTLVGGVTNTAGGYQFKVGHSNNQGEIGLYADSSGADFLSFDRTNGHYNDLKIHAASTYFTRGNQPVHIGSTSPEFRVNQMLTLTSAGARGGMSINSYHNSAAGPLLDFNISRNCLLYTSPSPRDRG